MKIKYLGLLPGTIFIVWAHISIVVWKLSGAPTVDMNPLAAAIVLLFWVMISVGGFFYAIGLYD